MVVLCIGNPGMCDDSVAHEVERLLEERELPPYAALVSSSNADMGLLSLFTSVPRILVVDALDTGAEPGAVFRFTPDQAGLTAMRSNNIHGMGLGYLVTHARLQRVEPDVVIYGIQVENICPAPLGTLTEKVRAAAHEVAAMVAQELEDLQQAG